MPNMQYYHTQVSDISFNNPLIPVAAYFGDTGELGYDGPLYDELLSITDDVLGPSPIHIKYLSYVYDGFCI